MDSYAVSDCGKIQPNVSYLRKMKIIAISSNLGLDLEVTLK